MTTPAHAPTDAEPAHAPTDPEPARAPTDPEPAHAPTDPEPARAPTDAEPARAPTDPEPARAPTDAEPARGPIEDSEPRVAAIEQELSALFRRSRSASLRLARRVHPDMDAAGYALISQIELGTGTSGTGTRASDVAQILGLDKSTVSRGITQLENLGLIERVGDPDDGRARLLRLTSTGAERYEAMRTQRQTEFRAILDRWNPTDLADLARLLARLNTDLG
ncbi:MarR family winged helix-turn-helix transcriptional regulator [Kribbella solani]|uniref:MarR family winged helix-turn-helix transcriptional regulator n=1 Tax=Kribbella solani TaxID=236067 RepID=UPI0031CDE923